jgi:MFS family permease
MDRSGYRVGMSLGHILGVAGAMVAVWAIILGSLPIFLTGSFLLGLSRGPIELGRYGAAEANPPRRRGRAISLVVMGGTAGSLAGPPLIEFSSALADRFNLPEAAGPWATGGLLFVAALVVVNVFLRPDPKVIARRFAADEPDQPAHEGRGRTFLEVLRDPRARLAVGSMVFSQLAMVVVMTITPVHMHIQQHELAPITFVITAHTMGMFGLSFFTGWLVDSVGRVKMIVAGGLVLAVACLTAPLSDSVPWLATALFLLGLGWNFGFVAGSTLLDDVLGANEKGRVQGSTDALVKLSSGAGSLSSGLIFSATGFAVTSWITIVAAVIPIALVVMFNVAKQSLPLEGQVST